MRLKEQLDLGLTQVEAKPVGSGFYDLGVGYSKLTGLEGYAEAGWHATDWLSLYSKGYVRPGDYGGMVGVRGVF